MDKSGIHLGVWTNWSNGTIMGATLTTTRKQGDLLIAFTGFLIPFVASRFWRICCLLLHRYYSTSEARDAIHHQRQLILRNSASPDSGLASLINMLWSWGTSGHSRSKKKAQLARLFPIILFAVCCLSAFIVAGGLSSRISSAPGDVVLIKGDNCGIITNSNTPIATYWSAENQILNDAANYAAQCYSSTASDIVDCDRFVVKSLKTAITQTNLTCPFQDGICRSNNSNLLLDSGYIDSNDDLGLNTPPDQRFKWRYVLQCAPLMTEGYESQLIIQNRSWATYNYGSRTDANASTKHNFTYSIEDLDNQYYSARAGLTEIGGVNFRLGNFYSSTYRGELYVDSSDFAPVPELFRPDGDLSISFLSGNGVLFDGPMDDDWYRGTVFGLNLDRISGDSTLLKGYESAEAASPMGCLQQWQWCSTANSTNGGCGPLAGMLDSLEGACPYFNLQASEVEGDRPNSTTLIGTILTWPSLMSYNSVSDISQIVEKLGAKALSSQTLFSFGLQLPLPLNQWQLDVTNWWNIALAATQAQFINTAVGTTDPALKQGVLTPGNDHERLLCNSQKVRSTAYASFSLFGLLFTYVTGVLMVFTSFLLEPILGLLQRRRKYKEYAHLEWTTNATLQLHRLVQEELKCGKWDGCTDFIPTERTSTVMAGLDLEDLVHPIYRKQTLEDETTENGSGSAPSEIEDTTAPSDSNHHDPKVVTNVNVTDLDEDRLARVGSSGSSPVGTLIGSPTETQSGTREERQWPESSHGRDAVPANSGNHDLEIVSPPSNEQTGT